MDPQETEIEVHVDDAFADCVDIGLLIRCARATLHHQKIQEPVELSIVVTTDEAVQRLNFAYRGVNAPTDVLAFGNDEGSVFVAPDLGSRYLGDVIISFIQADAQAQDAGHTVDSELQLLTVHGVLHLLGHDHADPDDKAAMWLAQAAILRDCAS